MANLKTVIQMLAALPNPTVEEANGFLKYINLTIGERDTIDSLMDRDVCVNTALDLKREQIDQQQKVIQKQQSQLEYKDNELKRLREKIKSLGNEIANLNQNAAKKNQYKRALDEVRAENELLVEQIQKEVAKSGGYKHDRDAYKEQVAQLKAKGKPKQLQFPENHNSVHPYLKDFIRVGDIVKFKDGSCAADLMHDSFKLGHNFLGLNKDEWMVVAVNVACPTHTDGLASEVLSGMNNCIVKNLKGDVAFVSKLNIYVVRSWDDSKKIYDKYEKYF